MLQALYYYPRRHFLLLYLVLSSSIAVDVMKSSWTGSLTGLESDVSIGFGHGFGISQFTDRLPPWPRLSKLIMVEDTLTLQFLVLSCIG